MRCLILPAVIASFPLLLNSCATPYQSGVGSGVGGHGFRQVGADQFIVEFKGNGFTKPQRALDFARLRAAELTLEYGYRYFAVIGEQDRSSTSYVDMPSTSTTTGNVNSFGGFNATTVTTHNQVPVHKPGVNLVIRTFKTRPAGYLGPPLQDAIMVKTEIRAKYKVE